MKKIIISLFAVVGILMMSSSALAYTQCGSEVSSCNIAPFSFSTGITPTCFQSSTNISTAAGWCDILQIASNIIGLLYSLAIPIVIVMVAAGGFIILTAGGNENRVKKGRAFIMSAIIGAAIALGAGIIIGTVMNALHVTEKASLMPWLF
jgi:hypothetical protein